MVSFTVLVAASICGLAVAWPEPSPAAVLEDRAIDCVKVTGTLSVLQKLGPPATTFCRAYLKVPAKSTSTATVTTTTTPAVMYIVPPRHSCEKNTELMMPVRVRSRLSAVDVTSAACPAARRRNSYNDNRSPVVANGPNIEIRAADQDIEKRTDVLANLAAAAKISEGCSCLGLKSIVTTTKTTTRTAATPISSVTATATWCIVGTPVCNLKGAGVYSDCSSSSECCSGIRGTSFGFGACCNPSGGACVGYGITPGDERFDCCSGGCTDGVCD